MQRAFAQPLGIALTGFRKCDDFLSESFVGEIAATDQSKRDQAISNATPMTRIVSGSNLWPSR
jgi:hypothetical protein